MNISLAAGYEEIYGIDTMCYEDFVYHVPSHAIISFAILLNYKLNSPVNETNHHRQVFLFLFKQFPQRDQEDLVQKFDKYGHSNIKIIGSRYLLAMILKEVKRNADFEYKVQNSDSINFFKAYLKNVDEVHIKDDQLSEPSKFLTDPLDFNRAVWPTLIHQYQLNEHPDLRAEYLKVFCLMAFARENYKIYLREYLNNNGFETIGNYLKMIKCLIESSIHFNDEKKEISDPRFVNPQIPSSFLKHWSINTMIGEDVKLMDIKKYPLFFLPSHGYIVIDENLFYRKIYKGPFFDLIRKTSLNKTTSFEKFNQRISKEVLEKLYFKNVLRLFSFSKHSVALFDEENIDSFPDFYYRINKKILLIEFKSNFFPDTHLENPDFEKIKQLLDEKLIKNEKGKKKGIEQLAATINQIAEREFSSDPKLASFNNVSINPILCVDDFIFSLPGINTYLNERFNELIPPQKGCHIYPLTVMSVTTIFEHAISEDISNLIESIKYYHSYVNGERKRGQHFNANVGFEDVYNSIIKRKNPTYLNSRNMEAFASMAGLNGDDLNESI